MSGSDRLVLVTPPAYEPLTLDEVKDWVKDEGDGENDVILSQAIVAARHAFENFTDSVLLTQTWDWYLDEWPAYAEIDQLGWWDGIRQGAMPFVALDWVEVPKYPLQSVTSIKTYNDADAETVYSDDNYYVDAAGRPGRIVLRNDATPPSGTRAANAIIIRFVAGYGSGDADIAEDIKQGMLRFIAHLHEHRGDGGEDKQSEKGIVYESGAAGIWAHHKSWRL